MATTAFVLAVVLTPGRAVWAFAFYAGLLILAAANARLAPGTVFRRLVLEVPFVAFALLLPFIAEGERVEVFFLSLSGEGLAAAWNIIAKATLSVFAGILLASTTQSAEIVHGLGRLRVPRVVVAIAGFMVRYSDVVTGEMRRMRIARESRSYDPRWFWQARAVASSTGTLFIRSYERGERVYLSMLSRGYAGAIPAAETGRASAAKWAQTLLIPMIAGLVMTSAHLFS